MRYDEMMKQIRELEIKYGITPMASYYIDSLEERKSYLEWLLGDGNPGSHIPLI